jgi:arylsulfatase A-like enzyme
MKKLPNIVLIVMDTSGAKHFSIYGYHRRTTPYLDRIAENAVVYKRCISPAQWTIPSHASLFTGLYPSEHGLNTELPLPDWYYSLAEILKFSGYKTHAISSNGLISRLFNFQKGFDHFYETWKLFSSEDEFTQFERLFREKRKKKELEGEIKRFLFLLRYTFSVNKPDFIFKRLLDRVYKKVHGNIHKNSAYATQRTLKIAKKLLGHNSNTPVFLFLNFMETHMRYNPPQRFNKFIKTLPSSKKIRVQDWSHYALYPFTEETFCILNALYDGTLLFLDSVIWDLYSFLKDRKILDNTIFIITSDHGELIGEHGHFCHYFTLYNELIHIPLIIKYPKDFNLKGESLNLIQLHDLFATILEIIDSPFPVPESSGSILSTKRNFAVSQLLDVEYKVLVCKRENPSFERKNFMQPYTSIITEDMLKLTKRADGFVEFYDLSRDFYENNNLADEVTYSGKKQAVENLLKDIEKEYL